MKSYTDLEQSKKLAEILPLESADMFYHYVTSVKNYYEDVPKYIQVSNHFVFFHNDIPCWSLVVLLDFLPNNQGRYIKSLYWFDDAWHCEYVDEDGAGILGTSADNAIDACYEMIIKLHEQKLL